MAIKIRLKRLGRRNRPFFRITVMDVRSQRDGEPIERLGYYDPLVADDEKKISLDEDRVKYWLGVGAQPSTTVRSFLKARGILVPWETQERVAAKRAKRRARRIARAEKAGKKKGPQPTAAHMKKKAAAGGEKPKKKLTKAEKKQIEKAGG